MSMITTEGVPKNATYEEFSSQIPRPKQSMLKDLVHYQYVKHKELLELTQEKDMITEKVRKEHDIFDFKKRRDILSRRSALKGVKKLRETYGNYPSEIFTENWGKFKTIFGHMKREPDPEDPLSEDFIV